MTEVDDRARGISEKAAEAIARRNSLNLREAGAVLGLTRERVRQIARGRRLGTRDGRNWRLTPDDLASMVALRGTRYTEA